MTEAEFKAWFKGFSEAMGQNQLPTFEQWKRIKEEIGKLRSSPQPTPLPYPTPYFPPGVRNPLGPEKYYLNEPYKITCDAALNRW